MWHCPQNTNQITGPTDYRLPITSSLPFLRPLTYLVQFALFWQYLASFLLAKNGRGVAMYWSSPLVGKAVALELVPARPLTRLARRVRRRAGSQPSYDVFWAEELVNARLLSHYQAHALLSAAQSANSLEEPLQFSDSPLKIGNYIVLDRIKRSDIATTYRGKRPGDKRLSAIKRIHKCWASDDLTRSTLLSELDRWAKLADPRIVKITPVDLGDGGLALTSNWLSTGSLADALRAGRLLAPANALCLVYELLTLLARADAHGLVFGDLRPSNILLDPRGRPRLLDCGIRCAISGAGLLIERNLSPDRYDYVAPEVAEGAMAPDASSDIYSIGCLLYHMLTGRTPYFGGSAERKCVLHRTGRALDPRLLGIDTSPEIQCILEATLQADRSRRVGSYNDLLNRLSPEFLKNPRKTRARARRLLVGRSPTASSYRLGSTAKGYRHWGKLLVVIA